MFHGSPSNSYGVSVVNGLLFFVFQYCFTSVTICYAFNATGHAMWLKMALKHFSLQLPD